jgi:hypothetical protein
MSALFFASLVLLVPPSPPTPTLDSVDPEVRIAAIAQLASTAELSAVHRLVKAQHDPVYRVAASARQATDRVIQGVLTGWAAGGGVFDVRFIAADHHASALRASLVERYLESKVIRVTSRVAFGEGEATHVPGQALDVVLQRKRSAPTSDVGPVWQVLMAVPEGIVIHSFETTPETVAEVAISQRLEALLGHTTSPEVR